MEFDREVFDYLAGEKFSNGLTVKISPDGEPISDRFQIIESLCANKNIIHLGCVDHLPLINKKIEQNLWLHSRLCKCSKRCLGIDINKEGINFLRNDLGYTDVIYGDIVGEEIGEIKKNSWDYLVLGEVLEHMDDPCLFLSQIREKYTHNIDRLIITVPNAFSWQNITYTFQHRECINTDHRYWFTPYTLAKVVSQAGMSVEQFSFCQSIHECHGILSSVLHPTLLFQKILFSRYPVTRLTLLMVVKV
jgi:hypothetical protein